VRYRNLPDLVVIRHAEAEINRQIAQLRFGMTSFADRIVDSAPNWESPLTPGGVADSQTIGTWVYHNLPWPDRLVYSPIVRCQETAGHMGMQWENWHQNWEEDVSARERHFGSHNQVNNPQETEAFLSSQEARNADPISWKAHDGGEDFFDVAERAKLFLGGIQGSCRTTLVVTHSWFIWALRYTIERIPLDTIREMVLDPSQRIGYCDVFQYSSEGPGGSEADYLTWARTIRLPDPPQASEGWEYLNAYRPVGAAELLSRCQQR